LGAKNGGIAAAFRQLLEAMESQGKMPSSALPPGEAVETATSERLGHTKGHTMNTGRRGFLKIAGAAAAGSVPVSLASGKEKAATPPGRQEEGNTPLVTDLFLDNHLLEVTPGVARRLHQPRKHPANPVVRCDRWWEGNLLEPYTTLYDEKARLFKMWARTGTDWKSLRVGGHAAYMTYLTSTDGVHWEKPKLGVLEIARRRDHNIVFTSDTVPGKGTDRPRGKKKFITPSTPMT